MDSRKLLLEECMKMLAEMPDAEHEIIGTLTAHSGTDPQLGEIFIVARKENDAVQTHC